VAFLRDGFSRDHTSSISTDSHHRDVLRYTQPVSPQGPESGRRHEIFNAEHPIDPPAGRQQPIQLRPGGLGLVERITTFQLQRGS